MAGTWYESPIGATQRRTDKHTTEIMTQLPSLREEICEK